MSGGCRISDVVEEAGVWVAAGTTGKRVNWYDLDIAEDRLESRAEKDEELVQHRKLLSVCSVVF